MQIGPYRIDISFIARRTLRIFAVAWVLIFAIVSIGQRKLLYVPSGGESAPAAAGFTAMTTERLKTPDGESLVVWRQAAQPGQPTILFFHGNGGALNHYSHIFERFVREGYGLYAFSYRSYSGSTGQPSETANVADALQAYDALKASGPQAKDIVIYGASLGSGVAVQVAMQRDVAAVILESPYSSVVDVAYHRFWYLPVGLTIKDRYDSMAHIARVKHPILIMAGTLDSVIPVKFSQRLAAAAPSHSRYVEFPGGGHVDAFAHGGFDSVKAWITKHRKAEALLR